MAQPANAAETLSPSGGAELVGLVNVTKRFPGVVAVDDVSLAINAGEVHVLLGENGAGKSTLVGILAGLQEPDEGHLSVNGKRTRLASPSASLDAGISTVFQHSMLVPTLSVLENLILGAPWWQSSHRAGVEARMDELKRDFALSLPLDARTGDLSLGQQQQIEIARALLRDSRVLILDEATSMLTPQGAEELGARMRQLTDKGLAVIFITHKLSEAYHFGHRISVLKQGRLAGQLAPEALSALSEAEAIEQVVTMMFGRSSDSAEPIRRKTTATAQIVLSVEGLCTEGDNDVLGLDRITLDLKAGEILGIAGIDGNGQKQLAEALAGQRPVTSGRVSFDGADITGLSVSERRRRGLRYLTDDRLEEGTVGAFAVAENTVLKDIGEPPFWVSGIERPARIADHARDLIKRFAVSTPSEATPIGRLSGGNIQKVLLGRELTGEAKVVVFNKPTYGLDLQNIDASRDRLGAVAADGTGVILISTDLDELMALSDRIAVIEGGRIHGIIENDGTGEALRLRIGRLMAGEMDKETVEV
ncbi:putative B6 ABC transporter ATP-binding protein [Oceanibium sediminis]|uniref:putative B6 ABC transporter ATP-binding protein n=1 Tax=Oceanibium sediminis TaxID=2026339 RepID=UPI000DD32857|nr:ABC transporter ATP-binding protein [Oceanibium sediminis]